MYKLKSFNQKKIYYNKNLKYINIIIGYKKGRILKTRETFIIINRIKRFKQSFKWLNSLKLFFKWLKYEGACAWKVKNTIKIFYR